MKELFVKVRYWTLYVMDYIVCLAGSSVVMFYVALEAGKAAHREQGIALPSIPETVFFVVGWTIGCAAFWLIFRLFLIKWTRFKAGNDLGKKSRN
ncbi:hypothetical protein EG028_01870 [Chitinophaga barathri]|uniref:Uncharacterized protein n=1 Tax=Chitinophaga barathri TaxID=1647451 RepID=A0A3N4N600_9BACT|nr:hypothetical protein EG028_01870 [Chitinophaga barathri]